MNVHQRIALENAINQALDTVNKWKYDQVQIDVSNGKKRTMKQKAGNNSKQVQVFCGAAGSSEFVNINYTPKEKKPSFIMRYMKWLKATLFGRRDK